MTTFLVIGIVGLVLVAVSLVLGDLFGGALDVVGSDAFSSAVIGGFVSAFGFGTALAQGLGVPLVGALPVGVVLGAAFAWFAAWLTRLVRGGGSDGTPSSDDALGREAKVVTAIPGDGFGTVRVLIGGHLVSFNARSGEGEIPPGTPVHVTAVLSPTAVSVERVWGADQ